MVSDRKHGTATVTVVVDRAGQIVLSGPSVRTVEAEIVAATPAQIKVVPRSKLMKTLVQHGKAVAHITVRFTPTSGEVVVDSSSVELRLRSHNRRGRRAAQPEKART